MKQDSLYVNRQGFFGLLLHFLSSTALLSPYTNPVKS